MGFPGCSDLVRNLPASAWDLGLISGLRRSPGGGNSNPLLYSCPGNSMDSGAWQATVRGVAKSRTFMIIIGSLCIYKQGWKQKQRKGEIYKTCNIKLRNNYGRMIATLRRYSLEKLQCHCRTPYIRECIENRTCLLLLCLLLLLLSHFSRVWLCVTP